MSNSASYKDSRFLINWDPKRGSSLSFLGPGILEILDSLPFYVLLIDESHRILLANKATRETLGLEPHEIVGEYCPKVVHGLESGQYPGCPLEEAVKKQKGVEREHFDSKSGRWLKIAIYPTGTWTVGDKAIYLHMIQDITEQKFANDKLRLSEERLAKSLEREYTINEILQSALLPQAPSREDVDVGLFYRSAGNYSKVGGDFYDFVNLDDERLAIAVGDVSGKGLEAANLISMLKYTLRAYLAEGLPLETCMAKLNRLLCSEMPEEKFITLGVALIDTGKKTIDYISAGHPLPILSRNCRVSQVNVKQGLPLGISEQQEYEVLSVDVADQCYFLMYSDGLMEAGFKGGQAFGRKQFIQFLEEHELTDSQKAADELLDAAVDHAGENLTDDVSLVVVNIL